MYIKQTEGLSAFGKGIWPRMGLNIPSTAICWGTYEFIKGIIADKE